MGMDMLGGIAELRDEQWRNLTSRHGGKNSDAEVTALTWLKPDKWPL